MKTQMIGLVLAAAIAAPQVAHAQRSRPIVPPPVPDGLELSPDEFTPFFVAHAVGTQGYMCVVNNGAYKGSRSGRRLRDGRQVTTHFLSPQPFDKMTATRRIQRLNTVEGKAPATGCSIPDNIGKRALVPYEADYYFYKKKGRPADED